MILPQGRAGITGIAVLPCSRETSRTVGPLAWVVLEELALRTQGSGDPVLETNVRALASDLGVGKDTLAQALGRLIDLGLVRCQAQRRAGRYSGSRYELDVEACRHFGLVVDGLGINEDPLPVSSCPVQPDPAQRDAVAADTVAGESTSRTPARPTRSPQPVPQSLFDLSDEDSPSVTAQPPSDLPPPTPLSPSATPPYPRPQPALPTTLPSSLPPSNRPDALAPGVRRGPVNVAGVRAGERSALNGNLNAEAGSSC